MKMPASNNKLTYLDLFAGAGGLSEGFASVGYHPIAHVEMDQDACSTLKTRESFYYLQSNGMKCKYIAYLKGKITKESFYNLIPDEILNSVICETMSDETMPSIFERIDFAMERRNADHIDLILGGPPCQAYSMTGRARKNMEGDPRNTLYKLYFQAIEKYKPTMFVFENVPGLLTAGNGSYLNAILSGFRARGYELDYDILNASDYGVLQNRKRIILIGWQKGSGHEYPTLQKLPKVYLVSELFDDLPALKPGQQKNAYTHELREGYLSGTGIRKKNDVLTWHVARTNLERDRSIYRLVIQAWNKDHTRLKYTDIPDELATHNNKTSFLDRFKVVAPDLTATHTMVAHISKDGHYYIHPDLEQARSISVREAARIQSFPDDFYFEGSRTAAFRQIGNAVPPLLAQTIATAIN
ncbi:MAG: DNA cytosine methyltransferase [Candidatus Gastranaerophilales bacterium]|nr:DNA cytosine methyltransferase [Candidatus Gastranaerophilales bacterium]